MVRLCDIISVSLETVKRVHVLYINACLASPPAGRLWFCPGFYVGVISGHRLLSCHNAPVWNHPLSGGHHPSITLSRLHPLS